MKNFLLKLRTLLIVLLIIAGAGISIWLLEIIGQLVTNNDGIVGTIAFAILSLGVISIFIYFIKRRGKVIPSDKDTVKQEMLKEKIYNEIKGKHST